MPSFWDSVRSDFGRYREGQPFRLKHALHLFLTNPGFSAVVFLRLQVWLHSRGAYFASSLVRSFSVRKFGMDVVPGAQVGLGLMIHHPVGIVVGRGVKVGDGCTILQGVTLGERHADGSGLPIYPQIRDRCTIGANAVILGDVSVGPNSTVGASALVINDVPENCVAVGVPARSIPLKHVAAATERKAHND